MSGGECPHVLHVAAGRVRVHWPDRDLPARDLVQRIPGALTVRVSVLTGNVLVCFDEQRVDAAAVVAALAALASSQPLATVDRVPRDRTALSESAEGTELAAVSESALLLVAAVTGLAVVEVRRALHRPRPARTGPALAAAAIGLARDARALNRTTHHVPATIDLADTVLSLASIGALTASGGSLGLILLLAVSLRRLATVRARLAAWRLYLARVGRTGESGGRVVRLDEGARMPQPGRVLTGAGSAIGFDGLPLSIRPGDELGAGSRVWGSTFTVEVDGGAPAPCPPRSTPSRPTAAERYDLLAALLAIVGAGAVTTRTRRTSAGGAVLTLADPRPALVGAEAAELAASARLVRLGLTPCLPVRRRLQLPSALLVECPRALCDGLEIGPVASRTLPADETLRIVLGIAAAAGSPWGPIAASVEPARGERGSFDGAAAHATVDGVAYCLRPAPAGDRVAASQRQAGCWPLLLEEEAARVPIARIGLRPRLDPGLPDLLEACRRHRVELLLVAGDAGASMLTLATRASIRLVEEHDAEAATRRLQEGGALVAALVDGAGAPGLLHVADLEIALSTGRTSRFAGRADLLAPDLRAVAGAIDTVALLARAERDAVVLAAVESVGGLLWFGRRHPTARTIAAGLNLATLAALVAGAVRLRGGAPAHSSLLRIRDPHPERWGRQSVESALRTLRTRPRGLSAREAVARRRAMARTRSGNAFAAALLEQLRSPLVAVLAVGASFSLLAGSLLDVALIAAVVCANATLGAAEEANVNRAVAALHELTRPTARVLRSGRRLRVAAHEVVPGDVLLLAAGDRVAADARVIRAHGLHVDEASLTGESYPVEKTADDGGDESRVVLDGSDVTVGRGRAVVFAVGPDTRLGALAEALEVDAAAESPLGVRLGGMVREVLPAVAVGAALVLAVGLARRRPIVAQLVLAASTAVAAVPEGLPLVAGIGQAAVAKRLARRHALVRRLAAVEALGRVDVVCVDKTGTLTEGRLRVAVVASPAPEEEAPCSALAPALRRILLDAALASPRPTSSAAAAHPTDVAILDAAREAGLAGALAARRSREIPFDPARPFHAVTVNGELRVKGSPEEVLARCDAFVGHSGERPLDATARAAFLVRAAALADRGLRVLAVAEGTPGAAPLDPRSLVLVGFLGLGDSLRVGAREAVERCRAAGIRPVMLTGDHPATARAVAAEIGLAAAPEEVVTGDAIAALDDEALSLRLERASVLARIAPLDKVRVVQCLQRRGHVVAMTGDGVNDAPALRLADVGVAMGRSGSEVARQAADLVLTDDDFASLVEALAEGRAFWGNIRRALAILLGGNLGEVAFIVLGSATARDAPLTARQVLAVNLASDVLPVFPLVAQEPRQRDPHALAREGAAALGGPLRREIVRRAIATAVPTFVAYQVALRRGGANEAHLVAFAAIIGTQLAQSAAAGLADAGPSSPVLPAVGATALAVAAGLALAPLRGALALARPGAASVALVALAGAGALALDAAIAAAVEP